MPELIELEKLSRLRAAGREAVERRDRSFVAEQLQSTGLLVLLLAFLTANAVIAMILMQQAGFLAAILVVTSMLSVAVLAIVVGYRSPDRTARSFAERQDLSRLLLRLDVYLNGGRVVDSDSDRVQVEEMTRSITALIESDADSSPRTESSQIRQHQQEVPG